MTLLSHVFWTLVCWGFVALLLLGPEGPGQGALGPFIVALIITPPLLWSMGGPLGPSRRSG